MKKTFLVVTVLFTAVLLSCGGAEDKKVETTSTSSTSTDAPAATDNPSYDPVRGEGKFKDVQIAATLDKTMADGGEKVYSVKCSSCHKLTDEKLVGPGWTGVTSRHTAEWIMNFATNPDPMINKDPKVQALLELCLVRMPNQNVTDEDARNLYEFMRKNDGVK